LEEWLRDDGYDLEDDDSPPVVTPGPDENLDPDKLLEETRSSILCLPQLRRSTLEVLSRSISQRPSHRNLPHLGLLQCASEFSDIFGKESFNSLPEHRT
jgi:hypothetical protein